MEVGVGGALLLLVTNVEGGNECCSPLAPPPPPPPFHSLSYSKTYSLEVSKLNGILDEPIGGNFESFRNILSKVFKSHHLHINILHQTGAKNVDRKTNVVSRVHNILKMKKKRLSPTNASRKPRAQFPMSFIIYMHKHIQQILIIPGHSQVLCFVRKTGGPGTCCHVWVKTVAEQ